ncbi:polyamine ABC transporter substrate-binding protein [Siculibacillus lacustris]|uniref:Polyamine ABC transporter substrate-binding protein n=1 Tax=Siculibacillus lacustris TaxID=1549641 RepID=A0A4Q9VV01_9HYPH|nr:ABC transporter substrate-binding protein [Siculibacillus lacustris]TBW39526.1 polyamine ABC transporter substrate-binding protein [Siculibacillus lacustris]
MKRHIFATAAILLASFATARAETVLNIGMAAADIGQIDPHRATTTQDKPVVSWIFNGLVRFKPGSASLETLEPDLATSWDKSADGKTWIFHLRSGVKFHGDWGEMTAEDVVYSLKRAADGKTSAFAPDYAVVESIEAVDPVTVKIVLKKPIPALLGLVANYHGGNIVSKKAAEALGADFRTKPVGTGPFQIVEYKSNESLTLISNPNYFRGKPKIDKIVYRFIPADASRDLAFSSGELDIVYGRQDQRWVERFSKEPGTVVEVVKPSELATLYLNEGMKPLDDKRVRQAIAYAIDRPQIAGFKGAATAVPAVSVVPTGYLGTDEKAKLFPNDIAKAKALLTEAGYPNGVAIKVIQTSLPTMLNSMQIVQSQLKKAGIDLQFEVVDHQSFHSQIRKDLSGAVYYSAARFPVADVYLRQFFHSDSIVGKPTAVTNFSHCAVADAEIDAAAIEGDAAKQKELWKTAQAKIIEDVCAVPLFEQLQVWARKTTVDYGYTFEGAIHLGPVITEATTKK